MVWTKAILRAEPWTKSQQPKKILAIRFQALGDVMITLPYLQSLKDQIPKVRLHFLTRNEVCEIPKHLPFLDKVISIGGGRNGKLQFLLLLARLPWLWRQHYDLVIDLQNHRISRIIRKLLMAKAWSEFDAQSPISAGERTRQTIEASGQWKIDVQTKFKINSVESIPGFLYRNGLKPDHELVVLNPAGAFSSRNWPIENYIQFAKLWRKRVNSKTQFALLLLNNQRPKADRIVSALGEYCINLTGKLTQTEAFAIVQQSKLMISEDSGLMHMAWVQGIPTLALFGSSRKDWSAPQGAWSLCLDSSDLECGPCMLPVCKFGDNRCLIRYSPEEVVNRAQELLTKLRPEISDNWGTHTLA